MSDVIIGPNASVSPLGTSMENGTQEPILETDSGGSAFRTTFPKLFATNQGGSADELLEDPIKRNDLSRFHIVMINMLYKGATWLGTYVPLLRSAAATNENSNIKIINYVNCRSVGRTSSWEQPIRTKLAAEIGPYGDWYAYYTSGLVANVPPPYQGNDEVNVTNYVTEDSASLRVGQWQADWDHSQLSSYFDGVFHDVWDYEPVNHQIDYNQSGSAYSALNDNDKAAMDAQFRTGLMNYRDRVRGLSYLTSPAVFIGNCNGNAHSATEGHLNEPEYFRQLDGFVEYVHGTTYSEDEFRGFQGMMERYFYTIFNSGNGICVMNTQDADTGCRTYGINLEKNQRYLLACALLGNGYLSHQIKPNPSNNLGRWIDEYDNAGSTNAGWLGKAVDPSLVTYPFTPNKLYSARNWGTYAYIREFENGYVIVNPDWHGIGPAGTGQNPGSTYSAPYGDGVAIDDVPGGTQRIDGSASDGWNNGTVYATPTEVTLQPRDALFLVKT